MTEPTPPQARLSRRLFLGSTAVVSLLPVVVQAAQPTPTVAYGWTTIPFGGGGFVDGFLYHPKAEGLLYARTDVGGAYRFDPAGKRWLPLQDFLTREDGDLKGVLAFAVDPNDPERLYMACGEYLGTWARDGAVLCSEDRGENWTITALPKGVKLGGNADGRGCGERLQVDPNAGNVLWLGSSQDGLFKSQDHGGSFSGVSSPGKSITLVLIDPRNAAGGASQTLYVGCADDAGGLFKSNDGGATFVRISDLPKQIPQRAVLDGEGNLYVTLSDGRAPAGGTDGGLYCLDTKLGKWRDISPMKPGTGGARFAYCGLDIDPAKPGTVVVSTMNRYSIGDDIYLSRDGGSRWAAISPKARHSTAGYSWMTKSQAGREGMGNWIADVRIDPFHSDRLIYGTGSGIWMTSDLGNVDHNQEVHFDFAVANFEETVVQDMASPPAGAVLYAAMADVSGAGWDDVTKGPSDGYFPPAWETNTSIDYAEQAPQYVVRTANNHGSSGYLSADGGLTWTAFDTSPRQEKDDKGQWHGAGDIVISAKGTAMVWVPQKQPAFYSLDRGKTWKPSAGWQSDVNTGVSITADRAFDGIFYAHDRIAKTILISVDSGVTFKPVIMGLPPVQGYQTSFIVSAPGQVRDLWVGLPQGLFHAADEKSPLTQVKAVTEAWRLALGKAPDRKTYHTLYLWGKIRDQAGLWRSDDVGVNWVRISDAKHQFGGIRALCADPLEYGTVYVAPDGRGVVVGRPVT